MAVRRSMFVLSGIRNRSHVRDEALPDLNLARNGGVVDLCRGGMRLPCATLLDAQGRLKIPFGAAMIVTFSLHHRHSRLVIVPF